MIDWLIARLLLLIVRFQEYLEEDSYKEVEDLAGRLQAYKGKMLFCYFLSEWWWHCSYVYDYSRKYLYLGLCDKI